MFRGGRRGARGPSSSAIAGSLTGVARNSGSNGATLRAAQRSGGVSAGSRCSRPQAAQRRSTWEPPKAAFQMRVSHSERAGKQRRGDRDRRGCVSRRVGSARGGICPCLREQAHLRFELGSKGRDQHRTVGRFRQLKAVAVPKPPPAESRRANSRPAGLSAATRHTHMRNLSSVALKAAGCAVPPSATRPGTQASSSP